MGVPPGVPGGWVPPGVPGGWVRTYINRRNQELGSRAGPGPGPGPVQCRAMQRAATAAN